MQSAVGPVPETDTTVASQSRYAQVFASGSSFQDAYRGELIGVGQNRSFRRPGECPTTPQTFSVFLPRTVTLRRSSQSVCLLAVNTSVLKMPHPLTKLNSFPAKFAFRTFMCLDFHNYPRTENRGEKVKINEIPMQ